MILTILTSLNLLTFIYFYNFSENWLNNFLLLNGILILSYFEISVIKFFIEKFTGIEFLNHWD